MKILKIKNLELHHSVVSMNSLSRRRKVIFKDFFLVESFRSSFDYKREILTAIRFTTIIIRYFSL